MLYFPSPPAVDNAAVDSHTRVYKKMDFSRQSRSLLTLIDIDVSPARPPLPHAGQVTSHHSLNLALPLMAVTATAEEETADHVTRRVTSLQTCARSSVSRAVQRRSCIVVVGSISGPVSSRLAASAIPAAPLLSDCIIVIIIGDGGASAPRRFPGQAYRSALYCAHLPLSCRFRLPRHRAAGSNYALIMTEGTVLGKETFSAVCP